MYAQAIVQPNSFIPQTFKFISRPRSNRTGEKVTFFGNSMQPIKGSVLPSPEDLEMPNSRGVH